MDYQKAMLAELMSQYVDVDNKDFWDESVCKHYLVAFCPSQLFTNTKSDLGPCDKLHNDRLKERYQNSPDKHKYPFEADFYDYLNKLIRDLGRKINQGKGRLHIQLGEHNSEERKEEKQEKMVLLDVKIKELLQKIEEAGEEGRVQEATELTNQVEELEKELAGLKEGDDSEKSEKRMEVCSVCGAFLVTNDSSDRLEAHYQGKQHQGYLKIRETLDEWKNRRWNGRDNRDYSRARYDYRDRRDGGRDRDYRRYSDRERGYRGRDDRRRSRDSRDRRPEDEWSREVESYSRRSRDMPQRSRSRSPRRARYD
ncbi:uncharacterized protein BYT42DRAFT_581030 [Radiomyces spectabilis]|uniref:uncharacterized protein n=1 Tax=Radiomyces spectabilis TaxID=64574 RepID=UPI00221FFDFD|nr:uncharacterized protein BYT42DRAFT_581030 [Radiomyces spectabilis]KAI8371661.1 hypothetical protein BYT42DRAFT_581030 [Radiomyces spectabilis]